MTGPKNGGRPPVRRTWDDMAIGQIFPDCALGRKVFDVVDKEIKRLRNRLAHFILDTGELTIIADDARDLAEVIKWLPLTKCIARLLIGVEFPGALGRNPPP